MAPVEMRTKAEHRVSPTLLPMARMKREGLRGTVRRFWMDRTLRQWLLAWVGAPVLAIVNGAGRELAYKDRVGESTADQISVAPLIALLALYFWVLQRRWPLATRRDALAVGAAWAALSVFFEFGFGHYIEGDSWGELLRTYDVTAGNLWILIPLWIAAGPAAIRAIVASGERR